VRIWAPVNIIYVSLEIILAKTKTTEGSSCFRAHCSEAAQANVSCCYNVLLEMLS